MKKTIHGFRYDTDKADLVGEYEFPVQNLNYFKETLYRTPRSKKFFLIGRGAFNTKYRSKSKLLPLSKQEALLWAREYLSYSTIKRFFNP